MRLEPLAGRVIVRHDEIKEKATSYGIIIPDSVQERPTIAEVLAVACNGRDEGECTALQRISPGDRVMLGKYSGMEVEVPNLGAVTILGIFDIVGVFRG